MIRLVIVTIIWAFSFSLIGQYIAGKMDSYLAILIRLALGFIAFLPFFRLSEFNKRDGLCLIAIGSLQIGFMYIFYYKSFEYIPVVEVALFTISTPLLVSILGEILDRKFKMKKLINVGLVIVGAGVLKWNSITSGFLFGFILVQLANLSFATGQVLYKRLIPYSSQKNKFALFYLGALIPAFILCLLKSTFAFSAISTIQWAVLMWLGFIASGLCYYLWNSGAKLVTIGQLAVMNNAVIPLAILVNVLIWGKSVNWPSFLLGSSIIILGVVLEQSKSRQELANRV